MLSFHVDRKEDKDHKTPLEGICFEITSRTTGQDSGNCNRRKTGMHLQNSWDMRAEDLCTIPMSCMKKIRLTDLRR